MSASIPDYRLQFIKIGKRKINRGCPLSERRIGCKIFHPGNFLTDKYN